MSGLKADDESPTIRSLRLVCPSKKIFTFTPLFVLDAIAGVRATMFYISASAMPSLDLVEFGPQHIFVVFESLHLACCDLA